MLDFYKNDLIDRTLDRFNRTYSLLLDTSDYVPASYNRKRLSYIHKEEKRQWRKISRENRRYQKEMRKAMAAARRQARVNVNIDLVPGSFVSEENGSIIYLLPCPVKNNKGEQANVQEKKRETSE
ncbi:MAG: hypothetical protein K2N32_03005 [Clostridia bacterium]|nr:hypothetical protein [Clostridia bacterium]